MTRTRRAGLLPAALVGLGIAAACVSSAAGADPETPPALPPDPFAVVPGARPPTALAATRVSAPPDLAGPLGEILGEAADDPAAALERLRELPAPAQRVPGRELVEAALEARVAGDPEALRAAVRRLRGLLLDDPLPLLRPTARIELARAELALGRHAEAATSAQRAAREARGSGGGAELVESARFLHAEALRARAPARAEPLYRSLVDAETERIATAAGLRRAETERAAGVTVPDYGSRIEAAREAGVELRGWELSASEAAARAGRLEAALAGFRSFVEQEPPPRTRALAEIRVADLLHASGEAGESRELLRTVAGSRSGTPEGALAGVRLVELGLLRSEPERAVTRLRASALSGHPRVAAHAHAALGRELLRQGRAGEALRALSRASREAADDPLPERTVADLQRALAAALGEAEPGDCLTRIALLEVRRAHLMRAAADPEPFLQLGTCYEDMGLPDRAIEVYRSLARSLGAEGAEAVAFPLARASLASGDVDRARNAALAFASDPAAPTQWRLLLAESSLAAGDPDLALHVLQGLAASEDPTLDRGRVLELLIRTALELDDPGDARRLLDERLGAASGGGEGDAMPSGEVALAAADLYRSAGERRLARDLYARAHAGLPPGVRRNAAAWWVWRLGPAGEDAAIADLAARPEPDLVGRLAQNALAIDALQRRIGSPPAAGADR